MKMLLSEEERYGVLFGLLKYREVMVEKLIELLDAGMRVELEVDGGRVMMKGMECVVEGKIVGWLRKVLLNVRGRLWVDMMVGLLQSL